VDESTFEDERRKYQEHIEYLDDELELMKDILRNWVDEVERAKTQVEELKREIEQVKHTHKNEIRELMDGHAGEVEELKEALRLMGTKVQDIDRHMKGEIAINHELQNRQTHYIDVLRQEVITAKRILGNPRLKNKAFKEINFEQNYYYDYIPQAKEEGAQPEIFDP
jgi:FtsZ-binding cell division protein ZapB